MKRKPPDPDDVFLTLAAQRAMVNIRRLRGGPFGAVIVRKGKVIAAAANSVLGSNNPTRHAEINVIGLASRQLKRFHLEDCEIFSTTEPCPMCFSAIHWAQIRRLVYATTIPDVARLGFNELSIPAMKMKALGKSPVRVKRRPNAACSELLRRWAASPVKRVY